MRSQFRDVCLVLSGLEDTLQISDEQTDTIPVNAFNQILDIPEDTLEHNESHVVAEICEWAQKGDILFQQYLIKWIVLTFLKPYNTSD